MSKKKQDKKKLKKLRVIIVLLLLVLIALVSILVYQTYNSEEAVLEEINITDDMDDELILPKNLYLLVAEYDGDMTTEVISKTYNSFAQNMIPKYYKACKDLSTEELQSYYKKNSDTIYIELGYESYSEFSAFINAIKTLQGDTLVFESYLLLENTITTENSVTTAYLAISYEDNEEICFKTTLSDTINSDTISIYFDPDVDDETVEEGIKLREEQEAEIENEESPFTTGSPIE